jgi:rare lipoprotein A
MPSLRQAAAKPRNFMVLLLGGAALCACSTPQYAVRSGDGMVSGKGRQPTGQGGIYKVGEPYQVGGIWYVPREQPDYDETGIASYYGSDFHLKPTANGEIFDMAAPSAAHPTLPLPSMVEVTNLDNGKKLNVRVNDRGPFVGGRVIDLSQEAARELGFERQGTARVRVRYVGRASLDPMDGPRQYARNDVPAPAYAAPPTYSAPVAAAPIAAAAPIGSRPLVVTPSTPPASEYSGVTTAPPVKVAATALQPLNTPPTPVYSAPVVQPPIATPAAAPARTVYRVQAGAYGDQANAQRAVSQLAGTGAAVIEPVAVNGVTLYRVMLQASADEGAAWALRDEVAAYGFADARVIRPF